MDKYVDWSGRSTRQSDKQQGRPLLSMLSSIDNPTTQWSVSGVLCHRCNSTTPSPLKCILYTVDFLRLKLLPPPCAELLVKQAKTNWYKLNIMDLPAQKMCGTCAIREGFIWSSDTIWVPNPGKIEGALSENYIYIYIYIYIHNSCALHWLYTKPYETKLHKKCWVHRYSPDET